jgi:hypothetical protein
MATFLKTEGNDILGTDDVPEYTDFNTDDWIDYLSENKKRLTNDFRQQLSTHVMYEESSRKEYAKMHKVATGSKSGDSTASVLSVPGTPKSKTSPEQDPMLPPIVANTMATPGSFMRNIEASVPYAAKSHDPGTNGLDGLSLRGQI